jgi:protein-disulfide isomerase
MPSGKRARQQRQQAPPPVRSKGGPGLGARQASPRTLAIAGGVVLIVIVAVVLGIVLTKNSNGGAGTAPPDGDGPTIGIPSGLPAIGNSSRAGAEPSATDVATLFKGIPQKGFVLGDPKAPVTLVEYIDLQCSACQQFESTELQPLIDKYVRPGQMRIEMNTWNIIDGHYPGTDDSLRGQKATIAAAKQNKAFTFAELLYLNQGPEGGGWLTNATVANLAASVDGLNLSRLAQDADSAATQSIIKTVDDTAVRERFAATPTILLSKTGGTPKVVSSGVPDLTTLEGEIDALLKK